MRQQLNNLLLQRKGMTLMEVLIVMGLIGIISVPLIQVFFSGQKQFVVHQNILSEKSRCMVLQEKIKDEVWLAKNVRLVQEAKSLSLKSDEVALYLKKKDSGYYELIKETGKANSSSEQQVLLNEDYLKTLDLNMNFKLKGSSKKTLEVIIKEADYQIDTAIQLLNFNQGTDNVEGTEGQILIYTK
ncbi:MAG: prepilin-type N-terminal cleavage/methylation domain-containing protein [Candidatus Niameybacter stercoravium]|nr:prepilin-type N-terminal cleavage/methylation domain-containing protein [Candidatus Niameybacter stercoravium]